MFGSGEVLCQISDAVPTGHSAVWVTLKLFQEY